jgi:hypothetical protein
MGSDGALTFRNAAVDADVAKIPAGYQAVWSTFDNVTRATHRIGESSGRTTRIEAPAGLPRVPDAFIKVELSTIGATFPSSARPVHAYFQGRAGAWQLVGFERMPE